MVGGATVMQLAPMGSGLHTLRAGRQVEHGEVGLKAVLGFALIVAIGGWAVALSRPVPSARVAGHAVSETLPGVSEQRADKKGDSSRAPRRAPLVAVRERVEQAVAKDAPSTTPENLDDYLDGLIAQARARGRVSALEAMAGIEMIMRVDPDIDRQVAFTGRLDELAQELRGEPDAIQDPAAVRDELRELEDHLARGGYATEQERRALVQTYLERADALDLEERIEAVGRLDQLIGAAHVQEPADLEAQWSLVEHGQGEERRAAIEQLLAAAGALPPDEHLAHIQRLDALVAARNGAQP